MQYIYMLYQFQSSVMSNHQVGPVTITIPEVLTEDGVTLYLVLVEVGSVVYRQGCIFCKLI